MADDFFEQIKLFLPKYLTPEETKDLYAELRSFPNLTSFYLNSAKLQVDLLQGDGWTDLVVTDFYSRDHVQVNGIVLSNSCDVSSDNKRRLPVNILFSPIIKVSRFVERLQTCGLANDKIENQLNAIRQQKLTSVFYLPKSDNVIEESLVLLDNIHSQPLEHFLQNPRKPIFTLNQHFFYIFIIKLSIHFCRFQEDVSRF